MKGSEPMPSNPKPVRMWGWTNVYGKVVAANVYSLWPSSDWYGGTRIRGTFVPDKKPAKKGRKK